MLNSKHMVLLCCFLISATVSADEIKILSWNVSPQPYEKRQVDLEKMQPIPKVVSPDIVIVQELVGRVEADVIIDGLGWENVYSYVSEWNTSNSAGLNFALEVGVFSKFPIQHVTEYESKPDDVVGMVMRNGESSNIPVIERAITAEGISGIAHGSLHEKTRTTIRVDLDNGLSLFPVHLKSNYNQTCGKLRQIKDAFSDLKIENHLPDIVHKGLEQGLPSVVKEAVDNAKKREAVIAAVMVEANKALKEGRVPVIAGDFNTSYAPGWAGDTFEDCEVKPFSCEAYDFPPSSCEGDGYDDTLAILSAPLVGNVKWSILSKGLTRTFHDENYANLAIDHIAVPLELSDKFSKVKKLEGDLGSDHYPIWTIYTPDDATQ